ncbi:hypothetical protein NliqN6_0937 [Naganishia liquefaciens]|uniref:MFS transporter n=1 Tax=Naganishia liquefaciens TaxID=104408 RepID=A0A8H3YCN8_9TREE|nr:hypothetical protein NliqN6_0937 [Naganishia liquefaciens]
MLARDVYRVPTGPRIEQRNDTREDSQTTPESNSLSNRNYRRGLPIEAEFAVPPNLAPELEKYGLHAPTRDLVDDPDVEITLSPTTTIAPWIHARTRDVEAAEKFTLVHFEPGTEENPKEWTLCLAVALGSGMTTGNLPAQAETLGVSPEAIFLSIALFIVGFGIEPLLFAPFYVISMFFYSIFTLPSALAYNIGTTLVCRLIAGTASSAPMANVGGPIADIWDARERGTPMAVFSLTLLRVAIPCLLDPSHNRHSQHGALSRTAHWRLNRRRNRKLALDLLGTLYLPGSHLPHHPARARDLRPNLFEARSARLCKEYNTNAYKVAAGYA